MIGAFAAQPNCRNRLKISLILNTNLPKAVIPIKNLKIKRDIKNK